MPNISRSTVSLRLFDKKLDPENLTQLLGCTPSYSASAGETLILPNGKTRLVKIGYWRLEYGDSDAIDLEEKIELLLAKLTDNLDAWQKATKTIKTADLFCGLFLDTWNEGFQLSPNLLRKIAERNLTISFDLYSPTDSWDQIQDKLSDNEASK